MCDDIFVCYEYYLNLCSVVFKDFLMMMYVCDGFVCD